MFATNKQENIKNNEVKCANCAYYKLYRDQYACTYGSWFMHLFGAPEYVPAHASCNQFTYARNRNEKTR